MICEYNIVIIVLFTRYIAIVNFRTGGQIHTYIYNIHIPKSEESINFYVNYAYC